MKNVILIMGFQASGKSTLAGGYEHKGYVVLNRDTEGRKVIDLLPKMRESIKNGKNVVLDNTFPTKESRRPFIEEANNLGVNISCIHVRTSIEDAEFNACKRMIDTLGHLPSPEEIKKSNNPCVFSPTPLFKYRKQLEPPTQEEGFFFVTEQEFRRSDFEGYDNKALILDYDGTLRKSKCGNKWPISVEDVEVLPGRAEALKKYKEDGYILLGASNQSGIHKKTLDEDVAISTFDRTNELLGIDIDYAYCPHAYAPINCWCRKPMPGLLVHFIEKYKIDASKSIMVGDMTSDKTFAYRGGVRFQWADDFFRAEITV